MNCYNCKYRGTVAGSAHSSCKSLKDVCGDTENVSLIELLMSSGSVEMTVTDKETGLKKPMVSLNDHGVKNGWANWPLNFDPVWVEECLLYNEKTN
jgi:hypothetical protein